MTVDEFVAWAPNDRWELINGRPRAMAPASATHGIIQARFASVLTRHLDARGMPCVAVTEPAILPRVRSRSNMRVPDLAVTCSPVEPGQIALPDPVLVIEILSPTNESETWENVWTYVSIPSVQEVLVLRSAVIAADLLRRRPDSTWPEEPVQLGPSDALHLQCIGLTVPLAELYIGTYLARGKGRSNSASR
ncbi:MAG TPA: Uma2 family endonuclease, partial [Acetobacteraceae bacterium]|nr:Uma2 family endonuclease [Acetobacteraceae bacterium]